MSYRHALNIHPMYIDGPVLCFAPFNNVNCQNGFLYFNSEVIIIHCVICAISTIHRANFVSVFFRYIYHMIHIGLLERYC